MSEHRFFSKAELAKMPDWKVDGDGWLWRPARSGDAKRIEAASKDAHRMFTGDTSNPSNVGKTFCCEPYEATYLDGKVKFL